MMDPVTDQHLEMMMDLLMDQDLELETMLELTMVVNLSSEGD
jgi:hypothetical protein